MEVAVVGGGNMGRALAQAAIGQGVSRPEDMLVVEPDDSAREKCRQLGCRVEPEAVPALGNAVVVVLAVKPQQAPQALEQVGPWLKASQVAVSIMAGISLRAVQEGLKHQAVVRVMPNTPAQVGLGMNVYFADPACSAQQLKAAVTVLQATGEVLEARSEDAIDAATAVSGSGPAYVYYLAEHWMRAACALGFSAPEAERMVQQTLIGATALWKSTGLPVAALRQQVTSKGGTTAAALGHLDQAGVGQAVEEAVRKAYERAKELGR